MVLTTVACLHVVAANSAAGGLSAVPLNFQGDRSDRNAGLQAWGHLLGSAVLFNNVLATFPHLAASLKSMKPPHHCSRLHCSVMAVMTQEVSGLSGSEPVVPTEIAHREHDKHKLSLESIYVQ